MIKQKRNGQLIIISGTTCAGKGTVIKKLLERHNDLLLSTSYTSRPMRENDVDGVDYYFVSKEEFEKKIENDDFLEYAVVHYGQYYGTPKKEVYDLLEKGKDVILEIDVQGAKQIKEKFPETILIFIMAPSMSEVKRRIKMRGYESNEQMLKRFEVAYNEINEVNKYNYIIVNEDLAESVEKVEAILISEKCRTERIEEIRMESKEEIIHEFLVDPTSMPNKVIDYKD